MACAASQTPGLTQDKQGLEQKVECRVIESKDLAFKDDDFVGAGGHAGVYKAKFKGIDVAFKVIDRHKFTKAQKRQILAWKEAKNMFAVQKSSIVKFYGLVLGTDKEEYGVVMEWMERGSLEDLSKKVNIPCGLKVHMMLDVSDALKYLHGIGLIHADVKLANILINVKCEAKLGDFGLAFFQQRTSQLSSKGQRKGTRSHMAPELFSPDLFGLPKAKNSIKCDVWSFGITLYEVLLKKTPFEGDGLPDEAVIHQICLKDKLKEICQSELKECEVQPSILADLAVQCVAFDPKDRLTFKGINERLCHEYQKTYKVTHLDDISQMTKELENVGEFHRFDQTAREPSHDIVDLSKSYSQPTGIYGQQHQMQGDKLLPSGSRSAEDTVVQRVQNMSLEQKTESSQRQSGGNQSRPLAPVSAFRNQPPHGLMPSEQVPYVQQHHTPEPFMGQLPPSRYTPTSPLPAHHPYGSAQTFHPEYPYMPGQYQQVVPLQQPMGQFQQLPVQQRMTQFQPQNPANPSQLSNKPPTYTAKQKRLIKQWDLFLNNLIATSVTDYFIADNILSFDDVQRIERSGVTDRDRTSAFLQLLLTKGDKAIDKLCYAVRQEAQEFLADAIEWDDSRRQKPHTK